MRKIRFGLMGYGAWGSHHARAIARANGAELAAIAARSQASQERARQDHPGVPVYADPEVLLAREELDVADVVLPSHLHHPVARAALAHGRHVLLEKPMALSVADCRELVELARRQERLLAVGFELRFSSLWGKVRELIAAGGIGEPLYLLIELWRRPYRPGSDGWRHDPARVGNWILEEPIHFFDLARWYLSDHGEPTRVSAITSSRQADPSLPDNFTALVGFPGGAYAVITQTLAAFEHHQTVKVAGTGGSLWASWSGAMDRDLHPRHSLRHAFGESVRELSVASPAGEVHELQAQIQSLTDALRGGQFQGATGIDGGWSVALCLDALHSVRIGAPVVPDRTWLEAANR